MNQAMMYPNCSALDIPSYVGPNEVFASIGHWLSSVYVILCLHALPVWLVSSHIRLGLKVSTTPYLAWLVSCPPLLMLLTALGIILPSLGIFVEVLLELVIVVAMLKYIQWIVHRLGGSEELVAKCQEENVRIPLGTPPFVCLMGCSRPRVSSRALNCVMLAPVILLVIKLLILGVEIIYLLVGHQSSGDFFALDNVHNLAAIPIGLFGIYGFNMFLVIITKFVPEKGDFVLGLVLLVLFVLFDCTRLFFVFLSGTKMLTCVSPYMSVEIVCHFLKNCIKAFLATFIGIPFLAICKERTSTTQQSPLVHWSDSDPEDTEHRSENNPHHRVRAGHDKQDGADHHQVQSNSVPDLQRSI